MKTPDKCNKNYVDCSICAMNPVCQPIGFGKQTLSLAQAYLNKRISVNSNSTLFAKDETLTAIYAVCSGTFKLCDETESGEEKIIGFRFPGELLGEDALFPDNYNYSAIAIGDSSICKVSVDDMSSYSNIVPHLQQNLIQLLSKQSYANQKNQQSFIGRKTAESLLAAFLVNTAKRNAEHYQSETEINIAMSKSDIANFLGLRRETLSRLFSKLEKESLIAIDGKNINLLNYNELTKLANL